MQERTGVGRVFRTRAQWYVTPEIAHGALDDHLVAVQAVMPEDDPTATA